MHRVLVPPDAFQGDAVIVTDRRQLHHLRNVLRVAPGDGLECFDGAGEAYRGVVVRSTPRELIVEVRQRHRAASPVTRLILAQALIRPERFERLLQQATELGVERVIPLVTERTTVRMTGSPSERKRLRWERIMSEAARQCGRKTLPHLEAPRTLAETLPMFHDGMLVVIPTLATPAATMGEILSGQPAVSVAAALIGPEGDFTPSEVLMAQRCGAKPVSLGPLTLRSETAAIVTLTLLQRAAGVL